MKKLSFFRSTIIFIAMSLLTSGNCFSLIGSELFDLQAEDELSFKAETARWGVSSLISPKKYSICNDTFLLGGYSVLGHSKNQYFERVYIDLPTHNEIEFSLTFWILDNWGDGDYFQLRFDSVLISSWNFTSPVSSSNLCGGSSPDLASMTIKGRVTHSETSLTFRVISQLSHGFSVQSFGLRDLRFNFVKNPSLILLNSESSSICALAPVSLPESIPACKCEGASYEMIANSGQCLPCYESCSACSGSGADSCLACQEGFFLDENICVKCDRACGTCNGETSQDCLTCNSGYQKAESEDGATICSAIDPTLGENSFLNAPFETNKLSFITVSNLLQHSKYLNINMPPRLQLLAMSQGRNLQSLEYGMSMSEDMKSQFVKRSLPFIFERTKVHSSFLMNFWQEFTTFGILFVVVFASIFLEIIFTKVNWVFVREIARTLRIMVAWNLCFVLLATQINKIILYAYLELSTFSATSEHYSNLSLVICLVVILTVSALIIQIRKTVKTVNSNAIVPQGSIDTGFVNLKRTWESCRVFYAGFNSNRFFGRNFYLIYMLRIGLPALFSISMQKAPIAQTIIQTLISIAILGSLLYFKPLRSKLCHIQLSLIELIVVAMNFCLVMLAILDTVSKEVSETSIRLGDAIITGNFCINVLIVAFLPIKLFAGIKSVLPSLKTSTKQKKVLAILRFVDLLIQQGGMGFEQIFRDKSLASYKKLITDIEANVAAVMEKKPKKVKKMASKISPSKIAPSPFSSESRSTNLSRWNSSGSGIITDRENNENGSMNHLLKSPRDGSISTRTLNGDEMGQTHVTQRKGDDLNTIMTENEEGDMSFGDQTPRKDQEIVFNINKVTTTNPASARAYEKAARKKGRVFGQVQRSISLPKTVSNPENETVRDGSLAIVEDSEPVDILQKAYSQNIDGDDGQTPKFKKMNGRSMTLSSSQNTRMGETKSSFTRAKKCNHRQCNWYRKMCKSYFVWSPLRKHMNIPCALSILKNQPNRSLGSGIGSREIIPVVEGTRIIPGTIVLEDQQDQQEQETL